MRPVISGLVRQTFAAAAMGAVLIAALLANSREPHQASTANLLAERFIPARSVVLRSVEDCPVPKAVFENIEKPLTRSLSRPRTDPTVAPALQFRPAIPQRDDPVEIAPLSSLIASDHSTKPIRPAPSFRLCSNERMERG